MIASFIKNLAIIIEMIISKLFSWVCYAWVGCARVGKGWQSLAQVGTGCAQVVHRFSQDFTGWLTARVHWIIVRLPQVRDTQVSYLLIQIILD